ncbi:MAG: phosphoenolpyruvate synthase, partial [Roseiarcus sp.]
MADNSVYLRWFASVGNDDVALVGGKNASLGEMYHELGSQGIRIPNGFALTAQSYYEALEAANAGPALHALLDNLDITDLALLAKNAAEARRIVHAATGAGAMRQRIAAAYQVLEKEYGANVAVAVRSSATAEDLPTASFAGQHETYLNISGADDLFEACRQCFASLFTDRGIVYRVNNGFDHFKVGLSVGVMKMVRSDIGASGVIFTLDTESGFRDVVLITGSYGLGENVVQGTVDPDEFYVHKPTFRKGHRAVLRRSLGQKQVTMTLKKGHTGSSTRNEPTSLVKQARFCLTDDEALTLAGYAIAIEDHYSARAGHPQPMDIEWAKDGVDGLLYIVQARPETVASRRSATMLETYALTGDGPVLVSGKAVGEKIGSGVVRVIASTEELRTFRPGEVLVASATNPDWEPVMKTAGAIVTDHGGRTCHAAIVARELGVPAIVGTGNATTTLKTGARVTVSCAGETGAVYAGDV